MQVRDFRKSRDDMGWVTWWSHCLSVISKANNIIDFKHFIVLYETNNKIGWVEFGHDWRERWFEVSQELNHFDFEMIDGYFLAQSIIKCHDILSDGGFSFDGLINKDIILLLSAETYWFEKKGDWKYFDSQFWWVLMTQNMPTLKRKTPSFLQERAGIRHCFLSSLLFIMIESLLKSTKESR